MTTAPSYAFTVINSAVVPHPALSPIKLHAGTHALSEVAINAPFDPAILEMKDPEVSFPMDAATARHFMNDDGFITVTVLLDQDDYMRGYSLYLEDDDHNDHHQLAYDHAFDFGQPLACETTIVGVTVRDQHKCFIVTHTVRMDAALITALTEEV